MVCTIPYCNEFYLISPLQVRRLLSFQIMTVKDLTSLAESRITIQSIFPRTQPVPLGLGLKTQLSPPESCISIKVKGKPPNRRSLLKIIYGRERVYQFSIAAVTNDHSFSYLKQGQFIILQFCNPEDQETVWPKWVKSKYWQECISVWRQYPLQAYSVIGRI